MFGLRRLDFFTLLKTWTSSKRSSLQRSSPIWDSNCVLRTSACSIIERCNTSVCFKAFNPPIYYLSGSMKGDGHTILSIRMLTKTTERISLEQSAKGGVFAAARERRRICHSLVITVVGPKIRNTKKYRWEPSVSPLDER